MVSDIGRGNVCDSNTQSIFDVKKLPKLAHTYVRQYFCALILFMFFSVVLFQDSRRE